MVACKFSFMAERNACLGDLYTQGLADRMPRDFMSKELRDVLVRVRILTLVEYLSTIQGK